MPAFPAAGVSYGTYNFGPYTETVGIATRYVYDSAGRTVVYAVHDLTIRTVVTGTSTDAEVQQIREQLSEPGKPLVYDGRGFGNGLIVTGSLHDIQWGPKPQILNFKPLGGERACEILWRVEVCLAECRQAGRSGIMEWNFTTSFDTDRAGYTTRHYEGHIRVVQNRVPSRQPTDTPDRYLEDVLPAEVPGFRRTFGPRRFDESKSRMDFEVTDTEMGGNIQPEWVTDLRADQVVSSNVRGLVQWVSTITAEYEIAKVAPSGWIPAEHFFKVLLRQRIEHLAARLNLPAASPGPNARAGAGSIVPLAMSVREPDLYAAARKAHFSFTFSFVCHQRVVIGASGLWRPLGGDWRRWSQSLSGSALNPRGHARLVFDVGDDRVTDLCDQTPSPPDVVGTITRVLNGEPDDFFDRIYRSITKTASWVAYENRLVVLPADGNVCLSTLPDKPLTADDDVVGPGQQLLGPPWDALGAGGGLPPGPPPAGGNQIVNTTVNNFVQRRTKGFVYVLMIGRAARAKFPIPCPVLDKVEGVTPVPCNDPKQGDGFSHRQGFGAGAFPVYHARWQLRYALPEPPRTMPVLPNPMFGGE